MIPERTKGWLHTRRRVRFTNEGRVFVVLALGITVGAVNTGNNLLYLLLGTMIALLVLSALLAEVALRGVEIWRRPPAEIIAGRETFIGLGVRNHKTHLPTVGIAVREHFGHKRTLDPVPFVHLEPGASSVDGYRCVFPRRGRCRFRGWALETTFPFGLLVHWRLVDGQDTAIVYPRTDLPVAVPPMLGVGDAHGSTRRGTGDELYALRDYRPGDDYRRIAWKASAKRGELIMREMATGSITDVDLYFPNVAGKKKRDPRFESTLDVAASVALRLMERGFSVGLTTLNEQVQPGTGATHARRLLHVLALVRQLTPEEAETAAPSGPPAPPRGATRVVITTPWSTAFPSAHPVAAHVDGEHPTLVSAHVSPVAPPSPVEMVA